jgi:hypothetical protein
MPLYYLHGVQERGFFTVTTTIMYYIFYLITLLHVSVPKDHHQVDPQSTKVVIIFYQYGSISVYIYILVVIGGFLPRVCVLYG